MSIADCNEERAEAEYLYNIGAISVEEKARRRYLAKLLKYVD